MLPVGVPGIPKVKMRGACIAALNLRSRKTSQDTNDIGKTCSIYVSNKDKDLSIVIDTGASISLIPRVSNFVRTIKPCALQYLNGLSNTTKVIGEGKFSWIIRDVTEKTRIIKTTVHYVPKATVCIFSPQSYFQEHRGGALHLDQFGTTINLVDKSELTFPYQLSNKLPIILTPDSLC